MWQVQIKGRFKKEKETRGKFPIPLRKWWKIGQSRFLSSGKGASISRFVGPSVCRSVCLSVRLSKKILHIENDLSEQILENESYSGS